jgi:hypothetical protein
MSEYLRLTNNLLVSLGGIPSPEIFELKTSGNPDAPPPEMTDLKPGDRKFEPTEFVFFQGSLTRTYIIGHIPQEDAPALPILYAIVTSGVLARNNGQMQPFFTPIIREVVLVPDGVDGSDEVVDAHIESGLDIERYPISDSYLGIRNSAAIRIMDILADVKESVFLTYAESIGDEDHLILVDGSLRPSKDILKHGNWIGIYNNPELTPIEEEVSLGLGEDEVGAPFKIGANGNGYFWHLRMYSDIRKGPSWGIIKIENSLVNTDDMESKITAISSGILAERYPIHPQSEQENWRLYPLINARVFLNLQTTDETSILRFF